MEKRTLGHTGHKSTVAILGGFTLSQASEHEAAEIMTMVIEAGVNHIDVAPAYGEAELRLGPWLEKHRDSFFVGCKTTERSQRQAAEELQRSLERLRIDQFDLYQLHAVSSMQELDQALGEGGALHAILAAREQGLTRAIGITGHNPHVMLEATSRFDFDTVMFPINFVQYGLEAYRRASEEVLENCRQKDIGVIAIKSIAKALWGAKEPAFITWYEPFVDPIDIQAGVDFVLSQDVTCLCSPGDAALLPAFLTACEKSQRMEVDEQASLIERGRIYEPVFREGRYNVTV